MSSLVEDKLFEKEESAGDVNIVYSISILIFQMETPDPASLQKDAARDAIITKVIRVTKNMAEKEQPC